MQVLITDLPTECLSTDGNSLEIERTIHYLGSALRFRMQGEVVQQFKFNPATNDDGNRPVVDNGWFTALDGTNYYATTLINELPPNFQDGSFPTDSLAVIPWFETEDIPANFKAS